MNIALFILSHPGAQSLVDQNYEHWLGLEASDIFGVQHEDKPAMNWPIGIRVISIGSDPHRMAHKWVSRFVQVLAWAQQGARGYDQYVIAESDTIFLAKPDKVPELAGGTLAGFGSAGFHARHFFHCPWCFSPAGLSAFLLRAESMLSVGLDEQGMIDRFLGLMDNLYQHTGFSVTPISNWSRNTCELQDVPAVEWAISNGAWAVHGIKRPDVLAAIIRAYENVERNRPKTRHRPKQQSPRLSQPA